MRLLMGTILSLCLLIALAHPAAAAIITVAAGGSIQAAINAAAPGDTIVINDGTFSETLVIQGLDDLHLVAADATGLTGLGSRQVGVGGFFLTSVIVDGGLAPGASCLSIIDSQRVSVTGVTFQQCDGPGVHIQGNGAAIEDTRLFGSAVQSTNGPGVLIERGLRTHILSSALFLSQGSSGVVVDGSRQCLIADSTIRGNVDAGIQTLNNAGLTHMVNNHVIGNSVGILDAGIQSRIERNEVVSNTSNNVVIAATSQFADLAGNRANGLYQLSGVGIDFAADNQ